MTGLKCVSEFEISDCEGEKREVEWFDFSKGEKIKVPFYIYPYEKVEKFLWLNRQIEEKPSEEIKEITVEDFIKQIDGLSKFGIFYPEEILRRFYAAINSGNKFVILAGATGTGKTLLSLLFPAAKYNILEKIIKECTDEDMLKEKIQKELKNYICFLRVRPNWTSPKDVIGYFNPINNKFIKGPLYDFLERANNNIEKNKPFFLILDEMNLSHPEHYLSDILSAMETKGEIEIHESNEVERNDGIKKRVLYPPNLYIIGTINIDETTKELSPRLKSRAFLITLKANFEEYIKKQSDENKKKVAEILKIIDEYLSKIEIGIGYRDIKHISEYFEKSGWENKYLDNALIQKIIPRIHTADEKFTKVIEELIKVLKENFSEETEKFCEELEKLKKKFELHGVV